LKRRPYRIRYLGPAEQDLYNIYDYIARDAPVAAGKFIERLDDAIGSLAHTPFRGATVKLARLKERGYRYIVIGRYLAFYRVERREVVVYRVLHGAREWSRFL
jgi:toxin ParE1/3/4